MSVFMALDRSDLSEILPPRRQARKGKNYLPELSVLSGFAGVTLNQYNPSRENISSPPDEAGC